MTRDEIIRNVARAICCHNGCDAVGNAHDPARGQVAICQAHTYHDDAQAAILSTLLSIRPASDAMRKAGGLAINDDADVLVVTGHEAGQAFTAMIDQCIVELKG